MSPNLLVLFGLCALACLVQVANSHVFLGCYKDVAKARAMLDMGKVKSVDECEDKCKKYEFFGLQYGKYCVCDSRNIYWKYGKASNCSMPCAKGGQCGFRDANAVYRNTLSQINAPRTGLFLGCYNDKKTARAMHDMGKVKSVDQCANRCKGYEFFGLQYGKYCVCDSRNTFWKHGKASKCDMPCAAGGGHCGGRDKNAVYRSTLSHVPNKPVFVGCYKDKKIAGAMLDMAKVKSLKECEAKCKKYNFFGLQYGKYCVCDSRNTFAKYGKTSNCSMPCAKGIGQCGGRDANAVYRKNPSQVHAHASGVFLGCFNDKITNRAMYDMGQVESIDECAARCKRYHFFGLQYGKYCVCDSRNAFWSHGKTSNCSMPCAKGGKCGGRGKNAVYRTKITQ